MMFEGMALTLAALAVPGVAAEPPQACAATTPESCLQGKWTGTFGGHDWTFELMSDRGSWSGRYLTPTTAEWRSLESVKVKGDKVAFVIPSRPPMTFALTLGAARDQLAGDIDIGGLTILPFAAKRRS